MNEEIRCITKKGKTAKNEWQNDESDFLWALCSVHKKNMTILFPYLLVNMFKQRYITYVKSYKYLNKSISIKTNISTS